MASSRCCVSNQTVWLVLVPCILGCHSNPGASSKSGNGGGTSPNSTASSGASAGRSNAGQLGGTEQQSSATGGHHDTTLSASAGSITGSAGSTFNTGGTGQGINVGTSSSATLANPPPGGKAFIGVNFWRVDWEGPGDFFQSNVDWATTQNPWQPQLLTDLAPFGVLRFMDWNLANSDPNPQSNWSSRKSRTQSQESDPIAFEWQIDLCNRTLKDCWITVPIQADASFHENLAQLVYGSLDPRLRLYVELSNEVWNTSFPQAKIARNQADQLGLPAPANTCCTAETIKTANAYVYDAVRMFEQFESVFGKSSPRLVKVLSGQSAWDGPCQVHMVALKDATLNPKGTMPDVYAIAPYFGGTTLSALGADIASEMQGVTAHVACAGKLGLPVIAYEGGSDSFSASGNGCVTLQHDPGLYDLYKQYLDALAKAGMKGPFMQYTAVGSCWGLKEKTSDTLANSPKYRGVADWIAAHP